ncbi:TENX-like protein [Mya arenaria]|uniref:TENX-like protein n=1 Tax=Mya arenaria TaxID=6604 RepID=A0ABY7F359_MYAAR|nr:multiple epidermal growth factor-like domains protein 10 isoform X1 [Mya arenaria]WAR16067.1 TENX-like protein [Mya arenaria]
MNSLNKSLIVVFIILIKADSCVSQPSCFANCALCENSTVCTSCESGYFLWSAYECTACKYVGTNCVTCSNYTLCNECRPGFWGTTCQTFCSKGCNTEFCNSFDGTCTCTQGFYGPTCQYMCSDNCLTNTCGVNGECECKDGYYGNQCNGMCYSGCEKCSNGSSCSMCPSGKYGTNCGVSCECNGRCDFLTGECIHVTCPKTCASCRESDQCNECTFGWFGVRCNNTCSGNCNGGCEQYSGYCNACYTGYGGTECDIQCNYCRNGNCNRDGECTSCYNGNYGPLCNNKCSEDCVGNTCNQKDGSCQLTVQCPVKCVSCTDNVTCTECKNTYYGFMCTFKCSSTCKGGTCDIESGRCENCETSHYGDFCENICSQNCAGSLTESKCDSTGKCSRGCIDGFIGDTCTSEAEKQQTVRAEEDTSSGSVIVGAVCGALGLCVVLALVVMLVIKKKGLIRKERKKTYEDILPEVGQNEPYTTLEVTQTTEYEIPDSESRSGLSMESKDTGVYYNNENAYYKNVGGNVQKT